MVTSERLTHNERQILRPVLARYAQWSDAHDGPVFEAVERILTARSADMEARIRALHERVSGSPLTVCSHDGMTWPCPTVALLDAAPAGGAETKALCGESAPGGRCTMPLRHDGLHGQVALR